MSGNEGADLSAKSGARRSCISIPIKLCLSELKSFLKTELLYDWQKEWSSCSANPAIRYIRPNVTFLHNDTNLKRKDEITIHRLRLGRCSMNYYLFLMGKHHSGLCDVCLVQETIRHVFIECPKYTSQRKVLFGKARSKNGNLTLSDILGGKLLPFEAVCVFIRASEITV